MIALLVSLALAADNSATEPLGTYFRCHLVEVSDVSIAEPVTLNVFTPQTSGDEAKVEMSTGSSLLGDFRFDLIVGDLGANKYERKFYLSRDTLSSNDWIMSMTSEAEARVIGERYEVLFAQLGPLFSDEEGPSHVGDCMMMERSPRAVFENSTLAIELKK